MVSGRRTEDGGRRTEDGWQKTEGRGQKTDDGRQRTVRLKGEGEETAAGGGEVVAGFIGAGNYASRVLIPAFKAAGVSLETIVTSGGTSGVIHGKKAGFGYASTDVDAMLANDKINTVVIATQHNTHADFVIKALEAGKHVFVEKPLCLTEQELEKISGQWSVVGGRWTVGGEQEKGGSRTTDYRLPTTANGWLQPAVCPAGTEDEGVAGFGEGAEVVYHDHECRGHSGGSLDPGPGGGRRPDCRGGLSLY